MSKSGQQPSKADVGTQQPSQSGSTEASVRGNSAVTKPTGQKVSLERGKATRKKNPGKRAKAGGS